MVNNKVDVEKLKGSIVRRCYDIVLTDEQKTQMDNMVADAKVYEEDSSVFVLGITDGEEGGVDVVGDDMGVIIDKFDYIKGQIEKIHHDAIDNTKLLEMMKEYYERAS